MLKAKLGWLQENGLRSEIIALVFGMLLILETFGDAPLSLVHWEFGHYFRACLLAVS